MPKGYKTIIQFGDRVPADIQGEVLLFFDRIRDRERHRTLLRARLVRERLI